MLWEHVALIALAAVAIVLAVGIVRMTDRVDRAANEGERRMLAAIRIWRDWLNKDKKDNGND